VPPPPPKSLSDQIDSLLSSVSSEVYFGAAFLAFILLGRAADSAAPVRTFALMVMAAALTFVGFVRRHEEKQEAAAQIARDKAASEASPPPP
jgi:hypothetical protein